VAREHPDPAGITIGRRGLLKAAGAAGAALAAGAGLSALGVAGAAATGDVQAAASPSPSLPPRPTPTATPYANPVVDTYTTGDLGIFPLGAPLAKDAMRLTFLGTSFLPRIAQECNSVFVELGNGDSFVFDLGSGVSAKYNAYGVPPSRMTRVFLTHLHGDHTSDLITLYCFGPAQDRKTPLYLYGPSADDEMEGTHAFGILLKQLMKWHEESFSFLPTGTKLRGDGYDIITTELPYMKNPGLAYQDDGVRITHWPAVHARDGSISYKLEWNGLSMVFSGDTRPNDYMLENARGVDVLVHEMVLPPETWTAKNSGLQPGDPGWERAYDIALEVQESSHTPQLAFGYIANQVKPRLAIATHFQVNPDTLPRAVSDVKTWYAGEFAIATDMFVVDVTKRSIVQRQAFLDRYAFYPKMKLWPAEELAPPKYDGPLAQLNDDLVASIIPTEAYDPDHTET
jgi:ribonuclease Z